MRPHDDPVGSERGRASSECLELLQPPLEQGAKGDVRACDDLPVRCLGQGSGPKRLGVSQRSADGAGVLAVAAGAVPAEADDDLVEPGLELIDPRRAFRALRHDASGRSILDLVLDRRPRST